MRVLIVEDTQHKAATLTTCVESAGVRPSEISIVPDAVAARTALSSGTRFDVLLLDLQIPNRYGEGPKRQGGIDIVRWLLRGAPSRIPHHVVAVTAFDLENDAAQALAEGGVHVLRSEQSKEGWRTRITGLVKRVRLIQEDMVAGADPTEDAFAMVLTAVDVEYDQAKRVFTPVGQGVTRANVLWHKAELDTPSGARTVVIAKASQMGMPAAAVLAAKGIRLWRPSIVVQVGVCAGIKGEAELGDVIVPDPCWDWGSGKMGADGVLRPDPRPIALTEGVRALVAEGAERAPWALWREEFPGHKPSSAPRLLIRPAVSGPSVVEDPAVVASVKGQSRKVVGIDMENYGTYFAAANAGESAPTACCAVKSVVDYADPDKRDLYQPYGANISARFAHWLIERASSDTK